MLFLVLSSFCSPIVVGMKPCDNSFSRVQEKQGNDGREKLLRETTREQMGDVIPRVTFLRNVKNYCVSRVTKTTTLE